MLQLGPRDDDPVSQFLFKKKAEGKPYFVYMTAGAFSAREVSGYFNFAA